MNGIFGLWPSWQDIWKSALANMTPITGLPYDWNYVTSKIQELMGKPGVKTPDDLMASAYADYTSGKITYAQYQAVLQAAIELKRIAGQSSGLAQFGEILKWVAIIGGIGLGAYLLAPTVKKAIALIPFPEPKKA